MAIDMKGVKSANIHSVGYDPQSKTLAVCFRRGENPGNTFHYSGITPEQYAELNAAQSVGSWFHQNIRQKFIDGVKQE